MIKVIPITVVLLYLTACGSTGVIPIGGNTYMIDAQGGSAVQTAGRSKMNALTEAGEYCIKKNLEMNLIKMKAYDGIPGRRFPHTEVTFECVTSGNGERHTNPDMKIQIENIN